MEWEVHMGVQAIFGTDVRKCFDKLDGFPRRGVPRVAAHSVQCGHHLLLRPAWNVLSGHGFTAHAVQHHWVLLVGAAGAIDVFV